MKKAIAGLVLPVCFLLLPSLSGQDKKADGGKYIGVEKCKNCHEAKSKGSQFTVWKTTKHAQAFDALASDEAKKIAKEKGIPDPQQSAECLKCHVTAYGEPVERLVKPMDPKLGIQCESCHGPGEKHMKARMASEDESEGPLKIGDDEIVRRPDPKVCLGCHNEKSPSYKPFCFKKRFELIQHLDPRKKRTEEELKAMKCNCAASAPECKCCEKCKCKPTGTGGCGCKQGECGGFGDKK
ncbi:MAG: hypothetical protein HYY17_05555 [Planctomycetes bacterium]|nr:hypothetical protein [Planctomycetota bacterium]